jgi:hypothetical protein
MASYLDNLTQYTSKAQVVIAGLSLEAANIIDNNGNAFQQVDNINWYTMLLEGANDVTLNEELRLQLLTILVDNARLNEVPLVNVFGLYQTLGNTTISASEWGLITGNINDQLDLIAKFDTYLPLAGGTMTGNIVFGADELGIDVLNEGDTLNIGASSGVVQFGLDGVAKFNVIDEGSWQATNIGVLYGGLGNLNFASGTNGQAIVKSGAGYAFATLSGGDVVGTAPSVNNTVVRWDGVTGKLIQGSVVSISDTGSIQAASEISFNGSTSGFTAIVPSAIAGSGIQTLQNATGNIALNINRLDYFAATTSAQLASVISDETGTGLLVFNNTPTFITPILGVASGTSLSVTGGVTSGDAGSAAGTIVLKNSTNAFTQTIRGTSPGGASRIFDLPTSDPSGTQYLSGTIVGSTVTLAWSTLSALTNPMTTVGDIIYGGTVTSGVAAPTRLAANTSATNRFLRSVSSGNPSWEILVAADIPNIAISQVTNLQTILDQRLSDNLPSGQIFVGNLSDLAAGVTPSGDWTIDTTGVATIEPNAVTFDKFIQATGPQILVGTPDILGAQDFRQITLDPLTLQIDALGVMSSIAVGTGTVTNTGTLTLNSLVLGNGGTDVKVGNGFTTDGVSQLTLGVIGSSVGGLLLTNLTSGTIELRPVTGALGTTVLTLFAGSDTLVGLAATQTLTNKTLTAPQINGALLETTSTVGYVWTATNTTGAGSWQVAGGGGSGTVNSGTQYQLAYYATNGTAVSGLTLLTATRALVSDANGLPVASTVSTTQLQYLASATGTTGTTSTNLVFSTSPTLTTPDIGAATATSINKVAITAPATGSTLTIADSKTFTASNTLTFTGTDSSSVAFGAGGTVAYVGLANSWTSGIKQTFAPSATTAGVNVGSVSGDVSSPANGDLWYDSTGNLLRARINGASVSLGAGGGSGTVNSGTQYQLAYYATTGTAVSGLTTGTSGQVLALSAGLVPTWTTLSTSTTLTNLGAATASATLTNAAASVITWNWNSNTTTNSFVLGSTGLTTGSLLAVAHTTSAYTGAGGIVAFSSTGITSGNLLTLGISGSTAVSAENLLITNSSTANTSGRGLDISITGPTGSGNTFGAFISNTKTGATSTNTALSLTASGGTTNYALDVAAGIVRMAASTASLPHMLFTAGAAALTATTNGMLSYATVSSNSSFYLYKDSAVTKILTTDRNPDFATGSASGVIIADTSGTLTKSADLTALGIFTQTNTTTVANTAASTTVLGTLTGSSTLPASFFAVGKTIKIFVSGTYNQDSGSQDCALKLTIGGVAVGTITFTHNGGLTTVYYDAEFTLTCRTIGAAGTLQFLGIGRLNHTGTDLQNYFQVSSTSGSINTTGTLAIDLQADWVTANAANSITASIVTATYLN